MIDGGSKPTMDVSARLTRALVRRRLAWIGDWLAEGAGDAETRSAMANILTAHDRVSYGVRRGDLDTGGWTMIGWDERCCGRDTLNLNTVPVPRDVLSRAV